MKKRNATALSEILYQDINKVGDFTENAFQLLFEKILIIPSGVIYGLVTSTVGASGVSVTSGSIIDSTFAYGELEGASGVTLTSLPTSGTRYDIVSAKYLEVADSAGASYVLIDVESRTQTTQNVYRRKFGSIVVEVFQDSTSGALTGNRMPIAQLTVTSGGIQTITDLRTLVKPTNIDASSITLGGDLSGNANNATVEAIQGHPFSNTVPSTNQVPVWSGTEWVPSGLPSSGSTVTMSGDVSGSSDASTVDKIKNIPITGSAGAQKTVVHDGTNLVWTTVPTGSISSPLPATAVPLVESSSGAIGSVTGRYALEDHVHPAATASSTYSKQFYQELDDWFTNTTWDLAKNAASSNGLGTQIDSSHPGVVQFYLGNSGTDYIWWCKKGQFLLGTGEFVMEGVIYITQLATVGDDFIFEFGLTNDITNGTPTNGVFLEYNRSASTYWRYRAIDNSSATTNTSSTTVTAGWNTLKVVVNAAGTSAEFFVNGVSLGTISTNIPTTVGRHCYPKFGARKTAGTTAMFFEVDLTFIYFGVTATR